MSRGDCWEELSYLGLRFVEPIGIFNSLGDFAARSLPLPPFDGDAATYHLASSARVTRQEW